MSSRSMRPIAGALGDAAAALWLAPAYPHAVCGARIFPGHDRHRRSRCSRRAHAADRQLGSHNSDSAHEWDASFSWTKTITPGSAT
jgi:hypothetical protein